MTVVNLPGIVPTGTQVDNVLQWRGDVPIDDNSSGAINPTFYRFYDVVPGVSTTLIGDNLSLPQYDVIAPPNGTYYGYFTSCNATSPGYEGSPPDDPGSATFEATGTISGTGDPSNIVTVTADYTPSPVTNLVGLPGNHAVYLRWTNPAPDRYACIQIYRADGTKTSTSDDGWSAYALVTDKAQNSYNDTEPVNGQTHSYYLDTLSLVPGG